MLTALTFARALRQAWGVLRKRRARHQHDDVSGPRVAATRGGLSIRAGIGLAGSPRCGIRPTRLLYDRYMGANAFSVKLVKLGKV